MHCRSPIGCSEILIYLAVPSFLGRLFKYLCVLVFFFYVTPKFAGAFRRAQAISGVKPICRLVFIGNRQCRQV